MRDNDPTHERSPRRSPGAETGDSEADDSESQYPERSYGWRTGWGWLSADDPNAVPVNRGEDVPETRRQQLIDEGIVLLFLVAGLALVLFPEPATSMLGSVLILVGIAAWLTNSDG